MRCLQPKLWQLRVVKHIDQCSHKHACLKISSQQAMEPLMTPEMQQLLHCPCICPWASAHACPVHLHSGGILPTAVCTQLHGLLTQPCAGASPRQNPAAHTTQHPRHFRLSPNNTARTCCCSIPRCAHACKQTHMQGLRDITII
jgi:hypothetical protein